MQQKKDPKKLIEERPPMKHPDIVQPTDPEEPLNVPLEDPDVIPDEDPFEIPPYEVPEPGEGP